MGQLIYGDDASRFDLDDRTLAHLELVMLAKLRRNEPFSVTLLHDAGGRSTIWLSSASTIRIDLDQAKQPIDRSWLDEIMYQANGTGGVRLPFPPPA